MDNITVGMKIRLVDNIGENLSIGSTATVIYIDDFDQIFVDWTDGGHSKFTEEQFLRFFELAA